ncbi:hypothetical protein N7455_010828 [Penicillium solitum]|uniref:uncharacterized protein n=1 Tax=Penicillium solitum TaxID=60172 RepID=UPI0032C4B292|nr:hypothetical protein N7455_010828 [Penicillium solitum]
MTNLTWQDKCTAKQAGAAGKIPIEWRLTSKILQQSVLDVPSKCGILTKEKLAITELPDATSLRDKLATQELSTIEVTTAFCKRAAIAQQLTSCLTKTMFSEALVRAEELDAQFKTTGRPVEPLHVIPISLKETFNIKGVPSSLGFASFLDYQRAAQNSVLVDILLEAGAVLYVKTNVPQTMMTADPHNNVFGRVQNPHRSTLTAGGSSGGEGALVAMRGSILGIGTDIAGSIRIPSLCCGTCWSRAICRTHERSQSMSGIAPVAGPICHSVRDAEMLLRVVFNAKSDDMDDMTLGFPWMQPVKAPNQLTIGVLPEDPQTPLHPNMQRTLGSAIEKLENVTTVIVAVACLRFPVARPKYPSIALAIALPVRVSCEPRA